VQQYPADIAEICQQLGIKQFSVMASSAGTMYALALTLAPETRDLIVGKVRCSCSNATMHSGYLHAQLFMPSGYLRQ
jgi:pimeloyl-ACP methyl ester carboxylesterase